MAKIYYGVRNLSRRYSFAQKKTCKLYRQGNHGERPFQRLDDEGLEQRVDKYLMQYYNLYIILYYKRFITRQHKRNGNFI